MMNPEMPYYRSSSRHLFLATSALALVMCIGVAAAAASEHVDSTPQEVFDSMRSSFQPAKAKGVQVIPGIEMFVHQAARQFEIWTGKPAPWDDMLRVVTIALQERTAKAAKT